jgi:O-antigen/teichoic acid export membrane protein
MKKNIHIKGSVYLLVGNVLAGLLAYLYQVLAGRFMGPEQYGAFLSLIALSSILATPFGGFTLSLTRKVSIFSNLSILYKQRIYKNIIYKSLIYSLILLLILFITDKYYSSDFYTAIKQKNTLICFLSLFTILLHINSGFFIGLKSFSSQVYSQLYLNIFKIAFFMILIWINIVDITFQFYSLIAAYAITYALGYYAIFTKIKHGDRIYKQKTAEKFSFKEVFTFSIAHILSISLMQADIIFNNFYFSPNDSGNYSAAATVGKVILFLPLAFADSFFAHFSKGKAKSKSHSTLFTLMIFTSIVSIIISTFFYFFSEDIISLFFGEKFHSSAKILKWYGFIITPISLAFLLENYVIATGNYFYTFILFIVFVSFLIASIYWHPSLISIQILIMAACILFLSIFFIVSYLKNNELRKT